VREVIAAVERIGGRKVPHREIARRPGDPPELVADPALALAQLGWQPRHSDLDTIIGTALAWETRPGRPPHPADK
jgi:UDP-glucose 4-epimerase